jgi:hypothetical protein
MDPYYRRLRNPFEDQIHDLNSTVACLISNIARLNGSNRHPLDSVEHVCLINSQILVANEELATQVDAPGEVVKALQVELVKPRKKGHPKVQVSIQG